MLADKFERMMTLMDTFNHWHPGSDKFAVLLSQSVTTLTSRVTALEETLQEHTNAIKLRRNTSRWWPHPRVRTSPEMGPGATVGTPGLGYPLLLCLGKSLSSHP